MVLRETFDRECSRILLLAQTQPRSPGTTLSPQPIVQAVKALCFTLLCIETPALRTAVPGLVEACESFGESGSSADDVAVQLAELAAAVDDVIAIFGRATNQTLTFLPEKSKSRISRRFLSLDISSYTWRSAGSRDAS
jgi:hypothetical protein